MSGYLACVLSRMAGTACHWCMNLTPRKAPLALIVQGFPSFRRAPLAQKDKTPTLTGQSQTEADGRRGMLCAWARRALGANALAGMLIASCQSQLHADDGDYRSCLPDRLHPVSAKILAAFLDGRLTEMDFLWGFHLPNSDYLSVSACIIASLHNETPESCIPEDPAEGGSDSCLSF
jgi:hypothetical protein